MGGFVGVDAVLKVRDVFSELRDSDIVLANHPAQKPPKHAKNNTASESKGGDIHGFMGWRPTYSPAW